ncbi:predicted protein [Naegleria gruberi]|uniref:Predicted protein n=1 Tax=Naegleria gruberi TaxID=5762 RepID=D2VV67_NAEGR|nr:uncharacterized protein NAEGRDRAFT_52509 [Naegleria gruberi]EFC39183.1 predicted protein [Naegleria gruberi]|eukprot:XP_002671927.1 predicted protein [Naegleria gruberi strain NEG-M]
MKRKHEESPSQSNKQTKRKNGKEEDAERKTWSYTPFVPYSSNNLTVCEKGVLDAKKHIYVEQTNFISDHFVKALQKKSFFSFQGSPNSGKSSMILNSIIPMIRDNKENNNYLLLYVDLAVVMKDWVIKKTGGSVSFQHCFMDYVLKKLRSQASVPQSILTLFSLNSPYCQELRKSIILFMDHADDIHKLPYEERRTFVESWLRISETRVQFSLFSIVVIGNSVIRPFSIRDEEKNIMVSPFCKHAFVPYFSRDELVHFTKQFLNIPITMEIIDRIYERYTYGHIGQSIIMLKYYTYLWEGCNPPSNVEEWEYDILSDNFWEFLKNDSFHAKIFESLSNDKLMEPLIRWLKDEREGRGLNLDLSIEDQLARIGVIQLSQKRFHLTSHLMRDLVETAYTEPPQLSTNVI